MGSPETSRAIYDPRRPATHAYGIPLAPAWPPPPSVDAQGRVMRDILGYFRLTLAGAGDPLSLPTFHRHIMRHYTPREKDAFEPAVDALAAHGLVERRAGTIYLTHSGKVAIDGHASHK